MNDPFCEASAQSVPSGPESSVAFRIRRFHLRLLTVSPFGGTVDISGVWSAVCLLPTAFCLLFFAGACTVGPKYAKPTVSTPPAYMELAPSVAGPPSEWKASQPQDQVLRGKWWEIFTDAQLNSLEERVDVSNQNLKIAEAQFRQARDVIRINR